MTEERKSTFYDMSGVHVFIGMPAHRELSPFTNASLMDTATVLGARRISFEQHIVFGGSVVTFARTGVANRFLQSKATHLFWIDSDMVWTADDFLTILALSTKLECVGATYPSKEMPPKFMINVLDDAVELETNDHGCFELSGFGLGFTCVQRKVMEQLAAKAPKLVFPGSPDPIPHMFREDSYDGAVRGEDMAFFADVRALGYKVNLFPHINLGHVGPHVFRADFMAAMKEIDNASRNQDRDEAAGPAAEQNPGEAALRLLSGGPGPSEAPNDPRAAKGAARRNHQPAA